jgi:hypothetical protein
MRLTHNTHLQQQEISPRNRSILNDHHRPSSQARVRDVQKTAPLPTTKARTCLSKGRHFEIFHFGQSYDRAGLEDT